MSIYNSYSNQDDYNDAPVRSQAAEGLAVTASFIGIASIGASFVMPVLLPFILAPVSIMLAILSKGNQEKMTPTARRAVRFALTGLVVNTIMTGYTAVSAIRMIRDPERRELLNETTYNLYGYTFDDLMEQIEQTYGISLDITPEEAAR